MIGLMGGYRLGAMVAVIVLGARKVADTPPQAGVPAGVFNLIQGDGPGVGVALAQSLGLAAAGAVSHAEALGVLRPGQDVARPHGCAKRVKEGRTGFDRRGVRVEVSRGSLGHVRELQSDRR